MSEQPPDEQIILFNNLIHACQRGDELEIEVLSKSPDFLRVLQFSDSADQTPLFWACDRRHWNLAKTLIELGSNVNARSKNGWTPLTLAVWFSSIDMVNYFVKIPHINPNIITETGWNALHMAIHFKKLEIARILLTCPNLDINSVAPSWIHPPFFSGFTALHFAICFSLYPLIKPLVDFPNINLGIKDARLRTPLELAMGEGGIGMTAKILSLFSSKNLPKSDLDEPSYFPNLSANPALCRNDTPVTISNKQLITLLPPPIRQGHERTSRTRRLRDPLLERMRPLNSSTQPSLEESFGEQITLLDQSEQEMDDSSIPLSKPTQMKTDLDHIDPSQEMDENENNQTTELRPPSRSTSNQISSLSLSSCSSSFSSSFPPPNPILTNNAEDDNELVLITSMTCENSLKSSKKQNKVSLKKSESSNPKTKQNKH